MQYKLDRQALGTVHLNAIVRIYGEHGNELLELLAKNPAGAIPVVLKRLKQKDAEWRKARQEIARQWKELLEKNYHRALDHRSFYFRQHEKRVVLPRHLVSELREKHAATVEKSSAAAAAAGGAANGAAAVKPEPGAADAPRPRPRPPRPRPRPPARPPPTPGDAPALAAAAASLASAGLALFGAPDMTFGAGGVQAHRVAHNVLLHAAEHSTLSGPDKARVAVLWKTLLGPFFQVPAWWLAATGAPAALDAEAAAGGADAMDVEQEQNARPR